MSTTTPTDKTDSEQHGTIGETIGTDDDGRRVEQLDQTYMAVPASWAENGRRETARDDYAKMYAEAVCIEHNVAVGDSISSTVEGVSAHVIYRHPETDKCREVSYRMTVRETGDGLSYGLKSPSFFRAIEVVHEDRLAQYRTLDRETVRALIEDSEEGE